MQHKLKNFFFMYRVAPHATTGVSPSTLFLGRELRTKLDLLVPQLESGVSQKQARQKMQHDHRAKFRELQIGQNMMARHFRPGPKYIYGEIVEKKGPLSYLVKVSDGVVWHTHIDQLKILRTVRGSTESRSI